MAVGGLIAMAYVAFVAIVLVLIAVCAADWGN